MDDLTERSGKGVQAPPVTTERCRTRVYAGSISGYPCGKPAKHEHKGKWYCGIHYPPRILAKREEQDRKFTERYEAAKAARKKQTDAQAALEREAARYRWLRDPLNAMHPAWDTIMSAVCEPWEVDRAIDAAISEAVCAEHPPTNAGAE